MKALKLTASRRRDKVVILSGVRYGSKLSTPHSTRHLSLSPFARFCLGLLGALLCFMALLGLFVLGGETALGAALSLALPYLCYRLKKGGLL